MSTPAIRIEHLSKQYQIGAHEAGATTFREAVTDVFTAPFRRFRALSGAQPEASSFWALKDVSFEVQPGEVVGIIGRNGAGKSTLLKILSRITEPTSGRIEIHGRVASLLEVGTGFHPELTGRENVFLNGAILGMSRQEIRAKFDEIVDFSGVEKFLDTPIKRYSSGMQVRLAFAVAAHLDPEILIIDEVLAVGDAEFQKKCLGKMQSVARGGRTILFVSHNMPAVANLCDVGVLLRNGTMVMHGETERVLGEYHSSSASLHSTAELGTYPRSANLLPVIQRMEFLDAAGQIVQEIPARTPLTIRLHYRHHEPLASPRFGLQFQTITGTTVFWVQTRLQCRDFPDLPAQGVVTCRIPSLPLVPGDFLVVPGCGAKGVQLDLLPDGIRLGVTPVDVYGTGRLPTMNHGLVLVDASWDASLPDDAESGSVAEMPCAWGTSADQV